MFNKLKLRKAPLSLSSVSNAIKNAGSADLSPADLKPKDLKVMAGDQWGVPPDSVVAMDFDPVQSLLAVCTKDNAVRVYGQQLVEVVFEFKTSSHIAFLKFVKGVYLVSVQVSGTLTILSLHSKEILANYTCPGTVTAVDADPSMDWLAVGLNNGSLLFYDVDRFSITPFRIDNLQKKVLPKHKMSQVKHIEWHPRDIGTLLVTYDYCAVQYSLASGLVKNAFVYNIARGCKGFEYSKTIEEVGKKKLFGSTKEIIPQVVEAHWHPNGLHVVTIHKDGTLAFWDASTATLLEARTTKITGLQEPGDGTDLVIEEAPQEIHAKWIAGQDPEVTQLMVSGASGFQPNVLDILDFGITLKYSMASYEKQTEFYRKPQNGQHKIPIQFNRRSQETGPLETISRLLPLAADGQPYFSGCHNPSGILAISNMGALYYADYKANLGPASKLAERNILPPSLAFMCPPSTFFTVVYIRRQDWFSVLSSRRVQTGEDPHLLSGGAAVDKHFPKSIGLDESYHKIAVSGHENGSVRLVDMTSGEYHNQKEFILIELQGTLADGKSLSSYRVENVSCGIENRAIAAGLANGNVVFCKLTKLGHYPLEKPPANTGYSSCPVLHQNGDAQIVSVRERVLGPMSHLGVLPDSLLVLPERDKISALKFSNAGFAAIGYKSGRLVVCDISRGPAVILNQESITRWVPSASGNCFATSIEFGIMEYGVEGFSSLLMFVGTSLGGNFLTFRIVPLPSGGFQVDFADKTIGLIYRNSQEEENPGIEAIIPINASTGELAVASLEMFQRLSQGVNVPGFIVVTCKKDIRILKTGKQKLAHKVVDEANLASLVIKFRDRGVAVASLTKNGFLKLFSIPALSDIADIKLPLDLFKKMKKSIDADLSWGSIILPDGQIVFKMNTTEVIELITYDEGMRANKPQKDKVSDLLFNENAIIPPRPAAGALLWAKGQTTYVSNKDLTLLIAGPNRKPAKHFESNLAYNISPEGNPGQAYGAPSGQKGGKGAESYAEPVRRAQKSNPYSFGTQGIMKSVRDGVDNAESTFNDFASGMSESLSETADSSKNSFYTSALKSKFGF